jgi:type II secretory pathway pseudopilin PulG
MTPEQITYVKGELAKGVTPEAVTEALRGSGYGEELIAQLLTASNSEIPASPAASEPQQAVAQKEGPSIVKIILIVLGVLVVVVVLIGILSTTVLSSLNDARDKGSVAATKSIVNNSRASAEIYYSSNVGSYANFCTSVDAPGETSSGAKIDCMDSATEYRLSASLINDGYYCADSTGFAGVTSQQQSSLSCQQ